MWELWSAVLRQIRRMALPFASLIPFDTACAYAMLFSCAVGSTACPPMSPSAIAFVVSNSPPLAATAAFTPAQMDLSSSPENKCTLQYMGSRVRMRMFAAMPRICVRIDSVALCTSGSFLDLHVAENAILVDTSTTSKAIFDI